MKTIQLATIALLMGAVTTFALQGQAPDYGTPPDSQQQYDDRRHDDDRYDDDRYDDDRRYQDDRRYDDDRRSPRADVGFFYDELSPYGDWVLTRDYGWAWFPRDVHPYWRPYSDGRWVTTTDYGWTWVSYEPFGWATYHYGRWARDPRLGWLWVPGTIWGPAWVSWQQGGGYVGWAPLPPAVGFEIGIGIRLGGFDLSLGIRPDAYSFVPERSFLESRLAGHLVPTARNVTIIHNTTNYTNYTYVDNRVVNRGVEVRRIEQATGRRVQRLRVAEARTRARTEVAASEVRIYRPKPKELDSVRVGPRANAGQRAETPRDKGRPAAERGDAAEWEVAPRAVRAPRIDARQLEQQERRKQQDLARYQGEEKRKLDKIQQQEIARARVQAERKQVQTRHQVEREALRQEQRDSADQLAARQKAQRQAALAKPPGREGEKKAADPKQDKQKGKGKGQQQQENNRRGQDEKPEGPPPA